MEKSKKKKVIAGAVGGIAIVAVGMGIGNNANKEKFEAQCKELLSSQTSILSELEGELKEVDALEDELQKTESLKDTSDAADIVASPKSDKKDTMKSINRCKTEKDQEKIRQHNELLAKKSSEATERKNKITTLIKDFGNNKKQYDEAMSLLNKLKGEAQAAYDATQGAVQDENIRAALKTEIDELDSFLSSNAAISSLADLRTLKAKAESRVKSLRTATENVNTSVEKKKEVDAENARVAAEQEAARKAEQEAARKAPAQERPATAPPASSGGQRGSDSGSGSVYYKNCDEARAAGVAPIHKGQPGYRPGLDRNHDGVACEPKKGKK